MWFLKLSKRLGTLVDQNTRIAYNPADWEDWAFRQGVGDDPTDKDTPPVREEGHFVLYHGTSLKRAKKIIQERTVLPDNWGMSGVNTTPSNAGTYAAMKASSEKDKSAVVGLIIDKAWLSQQEISREVGGNGVDSWLVPGIIPPEAIKQIWLERITGDSDWQNDYPDLVDQFGRRKASIEDNRPPRVFLETWIPSENYMKVWIGDKSYQYTATPDQYKTVDFLIRKGARNAVITFLKKVTLRSQST